MNASALASAAPLPPQERYRPKHFVGSSHSWAVGRVAALPRNVRVLDVGSGSGVLGSELRNLGFTDLSAVEVDPAARAHVAGIYSRVTESIDPFVHECSAGGGQFGLVLLLDVLEHMTDPFTFFRTLCTLVAPGGTILVSVPNIAHFTIRLALLAGYFPYASRGILDETHFQFFTRSRIRKLITSAPQAKIISEAVSIPPLEFLVPEGIAKSAPFQGMQQAHLALAQLLPGPLGFQLLSEVSVNTTGVN